MADETLAVLTFFDDIRRCMDVLTEGNAEKEFLRAMQLIIKYRDAAQMAEREVKRMEQEVEVSLQSLADLETKLFRARRMLEMESRARRDAENERIQLEKKMVAVADLVQHEIHIKDETTKEKLAFLNTLPRKRKSLNPRLEEKYANDINSTGSFLSDLSITQSEDDFLDVRQSGNWQRHRPSLPKNTVPCVGSKRSRLSGVNAGGGGGGGGGVPIGAHSTPPTSAGGPSVTRRSGTHRRSVGIQEHTLDVGAGAERICATTKVTIPQDGNGAIRAESTIESMPVHVTDGEGPAIAVEHIDDAPPATPMRTPFKQATAPPMTPSAAATLHSQLLGSPAQQLQQRQQTRPTMMRQHNLVSKTFIRADTCKQCQRKIRFGSVGLRCRDCPVRCHVDCRALLSIACVPQSSTPTLKGVMGYVSDYAPSVAPMIPALIVHCVNEIETRGLTEVGIYRVSGSEREVKALRERFQRAKGTPHLANIDVHVLCGCVKDFLRSLREPLIPTNMWKDFCNAVQNPSEKDIQRDLLGAIKNLPQANRDTLAFLILHFQRIAECHAVLMPIDNIARVFGPTIVGYSSPDPDQHAIFTEVYTQCTVMLNLLKIPTEYWTKYVALDMDKENSRSSASASASTAITATPKKSNKDSVLYATPMKSTLKKRKFLDTPYTLKK